MNTFARLAACCCAILLMVFASGAVQAAGAPGIEGEARLILAQNPLLAPGAAGQPQQQPGRGFGNPAGAQSQAEAPPAPGIFTRFSIWIDNTSQYYFNGKIAKAVRGFKEGDPFNAGLTLVTISFIYGVLHAAGPGHGKFVISAYVMANERTARRGLILAFLSAMVQAIVAVLIVLFFSLVLKTAGLQMQAARWVAIISSIGIISLGGWMLLSTIRKRWLRGAQTGHSAGHGHVHDHDHGENCGCGHAHVPDPRILDRDFSWLKGAAIVLAVGIRPCSGALLVLIFALSQGLFWAGIISAFAMALGTAITVSSLVLLAIGSRNLAMRGGGVWASRIETVAVFGGAVLILLLGVSLLIASLAPASPFAPNGA
jgi:nickel/cobalt transporter (NicO) family protein